LTISIKVIKLVVSLGKALNGIAS